MYQRSRVISWGLALLLTIYPAVCTSAMDMPANPREKPGYRLDFSDEFNGKTLDTLKWTDYYLPHWCSDASTARGNYRFENGCLIQYIDQDQQPWCPEHDGNLVSSAIMSFDKNWIHNFSGTETNYPRNTWYGYTTRYGYFEIRARLAKGGGGGHQAWWLVGMQQDTDDWTGSRQTGEIDIIENFFNEPSRWSYGGFGWNDTEFLPQWYQSHYDYKEGASLTEEFHIYAMEWTPACLKFYFDNQLIDVVPDSPDYEMGSILNIYTNTGNEPTNDLYPKEWAIDYYRVWKPEGSEYSSASSGEYYLKSVSSGRLAYIDPYSRRTLFGAVPEGREDYAKWIVTTDDNGRTRIQNSASGEYLHTANQYGYVEHNVLSGASSEGQWITETPDGYTIFKDAAHPSRAIGAEETSGSLACIPSDEAQTTGYWQMIPVTE